MWIGLGIVAVVLIGCVVALVATLGSDNNNGGGNGGSAAGIGQPARDGSFEFVVKDVKCGATSVGQSPVSKSAQGQFCIATVTVKNISDQPQTMSDTDQKGIGGNGSTYDADPEADIAANGADAKFLIADINPGNQLSGKLVFDVPKDVELTQLELHDSPFSGGVNVNVK